MTEYAQTEASKEVTVDDTSKQEMEEVLKIIRKSDYKIVEQLGQTPSKIFMLSLLLCSEAHAHNLVKFLKNAHVLCCTPKFSLSVIKNLLTRSPWAQDCTWV